MDSFYVMHQYGSDCGGLKSKDRGNKATNIEAWVGRKGILTALATHCDKCTTPRMASTIQKAHIPIRRFLSMEIRGCGSLTMRRRLESHELIPLIFKRRQTQAVWSSESARLQRDSLPDKTSPYHFSGDAKDACTTACHSSTYQPSTHLLGELVQTFLDALFLS